MIKSGPVKILHISVGIFAVTMGLITMVIGFNMDHFRTGREGLATCMMVFVLITLIYIMVQPIMDVVSTTRKTL